MKKLHEKSSILYSVASSIIRSVFKTEQSEDCTSEWRQSNETKRFNKILRQCVGLLQERRQYECPLKLVSVAFLCERLIVTQIGNRLTPVCGQEAYKKFNLLFQRKILDY